MRLVICYLYLTTSIDHATRAGRGLWIAWAKPGLESQCFIQSFVSERSKSRGNQYRPMARQIELIVWITSIGERVAAHVIAIFFFGCVLYSIVTDIAFLRRVTCYQNGANSDRTTIDWIRRSS